MILNYHVKQGRLNSLRLQMNYVYMVIQRGAKHLPVGFKSGSWFAGLSQSLSRWKCWLFCSIMNIQNSESSYSWTFILQDTVKKGTRNTEDTYAILLRRPRVQRVDTKANATLRSPRRCCIHNSLDPGILY